MVRDRPFTRGVKQTAFIIGIFLSLAGLLFGLGFLCYSVVMLFDSGQARGQAIIGGFSFFILALVTLGSGGSLLWHGVRALNKTPSKGIKLWPAWVLAGIFGLLVAAGLVFDQTSLDLVLVPPVLSLTAAMPPLAAVAWFANQNFDGLTWRRGSLAFVGGGTLGVIGALILSALLPLIILVLVFGLGQLMLREVEVLFEALAGEDIARAITSPAFIFAFVQLAIVAPLAEELAKPLSIWPWLKRVSRRQAFLLGALAGAGFAAVENMLYAGFGFGFWGGILLVRALGGAIHPLGSGLMALGWYDLLAERGSAWPKWIGRFALAAGMHALWNGGSLLVITLAGAQFFGTLPPEIDILGLSAAGVTLALLMILGIAALWLGRVTVQGLQSAQADPALARQLSISDRAMAIWAVACLVALVPAGIAGLQLLLGP